MTTKSPPLPPPAFADFDFTFDPALSNLFPNPPQLPPSEQLFSQDETLDLLGFLDNFQGMEWDMATQEASFNDYSTNMPPQLPNHLQQHPMHEDSSSPMLTRSTHQMHLNQHSHNAGSLFMNIDPPEQASIQHSPSIPSSSPTVELAGDRNGIPSRSKPLLSTPQKRLNHIMSEQKRRNAIRDGYAQLISLLSPAGAPHGIGMPTRGRPKGSGVRGKGQTKGKSGVLFRAVEYIQWLEEGRDALRAEVLRVEAAAGIAP